MLAEICEGHRREVAENCEMIEMYQFDAVVIFFKMLELIGLQIV